MYIALRLGCRVLGLTLLSVGLRSTFRPVHLQARWAVSSLRVCKVQPSQVPEGNGVGEINGPLLGVSSFLLILVSVLLIGTSIHIRRGHRHSGQRSSRSAVHFPSRGRARWVGGRRWPLSRRRQTSKGVSFYFPCISFGRSEICSFFQEYLFGDLYSAGYASS